MATSSKAISREALLSDNLWRLMLRLALPGVLGMMVISINNFVDALYVGHFIGSDAVAAIALAFPLTMIVAAVTSMVAVGSSSLLSRVMGEGDFESPGKITFNMGWLGLGASAILTVFCYVYTDKLVALVGGTGNQASLCADYFRIFSLGTIFRLPAIAFNMVIRSEGKIKEAMTYAVVAMVLNVILNYIFIGPMDLGIGGAAWATNVSMGIYLLLNLIYFFRGKASFPIGRAQMGFYPKLIKPILSVGISASLMQLMFLVQQAVVFRNVSHHGDDAEMAFMGACYRIVMLAVVPIFGFLQAFQPVVGMNFGAGQYKRVVRALWIFIIGATLFELAIWLPLQIWPRPVAALLLPNFEITDTHVYHFRIVTLSIPCVPFLFLVINLFQSIGKGGIAGFLISGRQVLFFVPGIYLMAHYFGILGVYAGHPAIDAFALLLTGYFAFREVRRLSSLKEIPLQLDSLADPLSISTSESEVSITQT